MKQITDEQLIAILKEEAIPALGCTEPVACALACAKCKEELGGIPDQITVWVSGNIYKNGMGVGIPGTGMTGLPIAAALGAVCGKTGYGLEVLKDVSQSNHLALAQECLKTGNVSIKIKEDAPDKLYVEAICKRGKDTVRTIIEHAHTNIILVEKNAAMLYEKKQTYQLEQKEQRPELSLARIWTFVNEIDFRRIGFMLEGAEMNKIISEEGLEQLYGLQIGRTLKDNMSKGILSDNLLNNILTRTTAASDARMDGCPKPVMTNSGSGNQGITVTIPVVVAAEQLNVSDERLCRALALSSLVAVHIHYYVGHLSALCGILIAATGASSGITYLMGGGYDQVVNAIKAMCSNITGMICDGAKQGCALKVYSGASAAVQASLLAMRNIKTNSDGIVEDDIERTIRNIGVISKLGMEQADKTILSIMVNKK